MDAISLFLYFVAFGLQLCGIKESRFILSIFAFIWSVKFYQFLRKFESLGIYIILVEKMVSDIVAYF